MIVWVGIILLLGFMGLANPGNTFIGGIASSIPLLGDLLNAHSLAIAYGNSISGFAIEFFKLFLIAVAVLLTNDILQPRTNKVGLLYRLAATLILLFVYTAIINAIFGSYNYIFNGIDWIGLTLFCALVVGFMIYSIIRFIRNEPPKGIMEPLANRLAGKFLSIMIKPFVITALMALIAVIIVQGIQGAVSFEGILQAISLIPVLIVVVILWVIIKIFWR